MKKNKMSRFLVKYIEEQQDNKIIYNILSSDEAFIMPIGEYVQWLAVKIDKNRFRFINLDNIVWMDTPMEKVPQKSFEYIS